MTNLSGGASSGREIILPSACLRQMMPEPDHVHVLTDWEEAQLHYMVASGVELLQPGEPWNGFLTLLRNEEEKAWGYMAGVRSPSGDLAYGKVVFGGFSRCSSMNFSIPHPADFRAEPALTMAMDEFEVAAGNTSQLTDVKKVADAWAPWFGGMATAMERVKRDLPPASITTAGDVVEARRQLKYMVPAHSVPRAAVATIVKGIWRFNDITIDPGGQATLHQRMPQARRGFASQPVAAF